MNEPKLKSNKKLVFYIGNKKIKLKSLIMAQIERWRQALTHASRTKLGLASDT